MSKYIKDAFEHDIEYNEQVQSIKKRKRSLKNLLDSTMIKKIKEDLKTERRSAKRSNRQKINSFIKSEIEKI